MRLEHFDRGVIRTNNMPTGDIAESLVAAKFGVQLSAGNTHGYDVLADGIRYQVKGHRVLPGKKGKHYGAIRNIELRPFDVLIAVHLDVNFAPLEAFSVEWQAVRKLSRYNAHVRGHTLAILSTASLVHGGIDQFELGSAAGEA
jgi:hypothetical protein